jgi:hypothetical protein
MGGASGRLASGVTLKDTAFFNEYIPELHGWNPSLVHHRHDECARPGGTADLFTVAILDSNDMELPTTGAADEFLDVSLGGGANLQVSTFGSARGALLAGCSHRAIAKPSTGSGAIILRGAAECGRGADGGACYAPAQAAVAELSSALLLVSVRDVFVTRTLPHYCRSA